MGFIFNVLLGFIAICFIIYLVIYLAVSFFMILIVPLPIALIIWLILVALFPFLFGGSSFLIVYILSVIITGSIIRKKEDGVSDFSSGSSSGSSNRSYAGYVLNKKSGVIHDRWSDSADEISETHKKYISYSEALELVGRNTRYRFKEE